MVSGPAAAYSDTITVKASACETLNFTVNGKPSNHYQIKKDAKVPTCEGFGAAEADAEASLAPPTMVTYADTTRAAIGDTATTTFNEVDTAILIPPKGWKGNSVKVELIVPYSFEIEKVEGESTAGWLIEMIVDSGLAGYVNDSTDNGNGKLKAHLAFTEKKKKGSRFSFSLNMLGGTYASASPDGGPDAEVSADDVLVYLPKGWTYHWASFKPLGVLQGEFGQGSGNLDRPSE
jgi:hypothetical protein